MQQTNFDVCIIGTSLRNSILAAALAQNGVKILHIDRNTYYGGEQATRSWSELSVNHDNQLKSCYVDMLPQLLYAQGDLIQLLIDTDICRYLEFHLVPNLFMFYEGKLSSMPLTKEDVFADSKLSLLDKRKSMKLLDKMRNNENFEGSIDELLAQCGLAQSRLSRMVSSFVFQQSAETLYSSEVAQRAQKFSNSIGRYGKSPFLYPLYGVSELPQAFCRSCAINGGVYILGCTKVESKQSSDSFQIVIQTGEQQVNVQANIVFEQDWASAHKIFRATYLLDAVPSFAEQASEDYSLVAIIQESSQIYALIVASQSQMVPKGKSLLNLWSQQPQDFEVVAKRLLTQSSNSVSIEKSLYLETTQEESLPVLHLDELVQDSRIQFEALMSQLGMIGPFFQSKESQDQ